MGLAKEWWKKNQIAVASLLAIAAVLLLSARVCVIYDRNAKLKGVIENQQEQLASAIEHLRLEREAYTNVIKKKDGELAALAKITQEYQEKLRAGSQTIAQLKQELASIDPAKKDEIIASQRKLISTLEQNLTLAYQTIEAKDKQIAALELKFTQCASYVVSLEDTIAKYEAISRSKDELIRGLEGKIKRSRLTTMLSTATLIAAGVIILAR